MPHYQQTQASVIAVQSVPNSETEKYGIIALDKQKPESKRISAIVEKPPASKAPSNFAVVGRYILSPKIFTMLETTQRGAGQEIQLTDAISRLLELEAVYAHVLEGKRYDCGTKLGYLQATVNYALRHPEVGKEFGEYLREFEVEMVE